jgi:hypothetical protein
MLWGRTFSFVACFVTLAAAEASFDPVPVCQATANWKEFDGRPVAILGRYSFRETGPRKGRWLDQEACGDRNTHEFIRLALDQETAPKPPDPISIDEPALERKLAQIRQHTSLGKFRFGSADYDRWAIVVGRFEPHMEQSRGEDFQLTYRGDGAVLFLADR